MKRKKTTVFIQIERWIRRCAVTIQFSNGLLKNTNGGKVYTTLNNKDTVLIFFPSQPTFQKKNWYRFRKIENSYLSHEQHVSTCSMNEHFLLRYKSQPRRTFNELLIKPLLSTSNVQNSSHFWIIYFGRVAIQFQCCQIISIEYG